MYKKYFKRLLDLVFSILCMPILIIILFPVYLLIKFEDGGKVFFSGPRYGKNMKKFKMYKFRTMKEGAADIRNSDGSTYNSTSDDRLTAVGKFLRKTSLDEIPQIINVFKGNMSFIGPRPSPLGNECLYSKEVKKKFNVLPGITGLNQALYRNSSTAEQRYKNDVFYAEHVSFVLDIRILLMTFKTVVLRKNIYKN